ncbi:putative bifunctional diguanylate cyclase/phosphodiesterase [Micromonospora carbonacea]|uniref:Bifunctional diguanylate cyclase/phosphodiesterase n=1 Tax=Micromonospora carbonacea TaxID=47853 RepID=A0A7H8XSL4_9ACTN|nr:bifunctional diguanylate cyclase/phosphodiesterase [Micromonospora carbonacea]MBB5830082.1 diguanylate cyclase (GGDEF)-like protein [Micromonospora carbonacea]QLD27996.1 bifunctional diguanylate cyclase/phosphodiesterase [Micromonospora carbonacea]
MSGRSAADGLDDGRRPGIEEFVTAWTAALHRAHYVPISAGRRRRIVTGLADRLVSAVLADPAEPGDGRRIGEDLVAAGFGSPEALGRTIAVVGSRFLGELGLAADPTRAARLTGLLAELAAGFASAAHDRILRAQDTVRLAALAARNQAEEALRVSEARFRRFATHDQLTGLPNLTLFTERLGRLSAADEPIDRVGVCCLDVDDFAAVNDVLGHQVGDLLLREIAGRLGALTDRRIDLVARLDSDRFAILVRDTTCAEDTVKIADQALAALAAPFRVDGTEVPLTASAGVAEGAVADGGAAALMRASEIALHWAKADGKATLRQFDQDRSNADAARYRLSAAMPAALRRGEFVAAYQPISALRSGRLAGVEALARWQHPQLGLLSAARFIELAERTGVVVALGAQLLEQACRQASRWQRIQPGLYVSVNVSVRQLRQNGLAGAVAQILDRTGLPPHLLQLEVTEQAVIDLTGVVTETLAALMKIGVRIVIDDFGIGYANLANLRSLPLHGLKLDASLTRSSAQPARRPGARRPGTDDEFLSTVVSLGHKLGLVVTAEGIETAQQADRLAATGCDNGQGWHFGRPVPPDEITAGIVAQQHRDAVSPPDSGQPGLPARRR